MTSPARKRLPRPPRAVPCPIPVCPAKDVEQRVRAAEKRAARAHERIDNLEAKTAAMHTELNERQDLALDPIRENLEQALRLLTQIWNHLGLRQPEDGT